MEIKVKSYSKQSSLISSILFFILGALVFTKAAELAKMISIIIGVLLAVIGTVLITYFYFTSKQQVYSKKSLIFGIISIILAIVFIGFSDVVGHFVRFIVGAWILFSGIMRLINVLTMGGKNTKFFPLLIVSILLIGLGIFTILVENELEIIGILMMIYAAIEIVGFIFYTKDKQAKEEVGVTSIIVPEKETNIERKEKVNIKDAKENNDK